MEIGGLIHWCLLVLSVIFLSQSSLYLIRDFNLHTQVNRPSIEIVVLCYHSFYFVLIQSIWSHFMVREVQGLQFFCILHSIIVLLLIMITVTFPYVYCPRFSRKLVTLKLIRLSVRLSVFPSVTNTLTWLISSEVLMIDHWYLACFILVTSPSICNMRWPLPWPLTYFKVKFVSGRGTTILRVCLYSFL